MDNNTGLPQTHKGKKQSLEIAFIFCEKLHANSFGIILNLYIFFYYYYCFDNFSENLAFLFWIVDLTEDSCICLLYYTQKCIELETDSVIEKGDAAVASFLCT